MQCVIKIFLHNLCCFVAVYAVFLLNLFDRNFKKQTNFPINITGACVIFDFPNVSMLHIGWMNWNSNIAWYIYLPGYIGWLRYIGRMNWKAIR